MQAGTELAGRYVLAELLGRGGMGEVWRATDQVLGRPVAVKVISEWHADPELASRLKREAKIAASLQHPGIIVVHDVGSFDDRPFIVMELLHGRDLASTLKLCPDGLPVDTVISLGIQATDAVQAAHAGHVVHRDLKPANLFLQESGNLKICDFGIARAAEATSGLTAAGRPIGTISYMSPEQCEGKQVDERSDLYSLGCVLYELLTGEPPFRAEWPAIMYHHVTKAPSSPRTLRPDIPAQLDKLILELLAKNPDARPASAGRVATALRAIQQRRTSPAHQRASTRNQVVRLPSRSAITTGLAFRYAVRSDVGLLREGNEDSAYAGPRLLAVADGMGGHAAGEVASALTIASMAELDAEQPGGDMRAALAMAVVAANARLHEKIIANPAVEGMGTTLTALLWSDGHAAICHIGDSRGYLLRDGELYQITHDHTLVQSLVDEGRISADDVSTHPQRSLLLRALDGRSIAEPDLSVHESLPGDRYLLCSDGLSGVVSDETLLDTLSTIEDPEVATRELIELAIRGGGPDNITCIVADVVDAATTRWPPTTAPVLAGAAATLDDLRLADGNGSFDGFEDHHEDRMRPARTAPQPAVDDLDLDPMLTSAVPSLMVSENGADPQVTRARRSHRAQPRRSRGRSAGNAPGSVPGKAHRRRWPIVTTALVVLVAVVVGGGYIFYRVSQSQYYVAANSSGQVLIYRGINYNILGINWFSPYQQTGLQLAQVPSTYQQVVKTADSSGSLTQVHQTVTNIDTAVNECRAKYLMQELWVSKENPYRAYQAKVAAAKQKHPTGGTANLGPQPPNPGPSPLAAGERPSSTGGTCPPPEAFGIPASVLTPAPSGSS